MSRRAMRVYQCTWDGAEWVVAATSKDNAARLIGMPVHQMSEYGQICHHRTVRELALAWPALPWWRQSWSDPWKMASHEQIQASGRNDISSDDTQQLDG